MEIVRKIFQIPRNFVHDLIDFFSVPLKNISLLMKAQHLLLNTGYILGVQPFRFDFNTGNLIRLKTKWEIDRWKFAAPVSCLLKLIIVFSFAKDNYYGNIHYTSAASLIRIINAVICLSSLTFDTHTISHKEETVALNNSTFKYYQNLQGKNFSDQSVRF